MKKEEVKKSGVVVERRFRIDSSTLRSSNYQKDDIPKLSDGFIEEGIRIDFYEDFLTREIVFVQTFPRGVVSKLDSNESFIPNNTDDSAPDGEQLVLLEV